MLKPVKFKGYNVEYAKDQPQYRPLPGYRAPNKNPGEFVTCWKFSFWDRIQVLFGKKLWIEYWTFGSPLQPTKVTMKKKDTSLSIT